MKKNLTLILALVAAMSTWAASLTDLNFNEPTELPAAYVYSTSGSPVISSSAIEGKGCILLTNGGGGEVKAECFKEDNSLDPAQGKRWMGFTVDMDCDVTIVVYSSKKTWTLYGKGANAHATFTQEKKQWDTWEITGLKQGESYILQVGSSQCYVASMAFNASCTAPETKLALAADKTTDVKAGDVITFTISGGNGNPTTLEGTNGETIADNKWTAVDGKHTFKVSQEMKGEICGGVAEVVINVGSETPDPDPDPDPEFNCGLMIKATTQQEVTGEIGGSVTTILSKGDSKKLDKNRYFGVTLKSGAFKEDDEFVINITAAADLGKCMLYADQDGNELIYDEGVEYSKSAPSATGEKKIKLPAAVNGKTSIFLYRGGDGAPQWNPTFDYISVTRTCDDGTAKLEVDKESVVLAITPKSAGKAEAKVIFSGVHLAAGTYNLALTEVAGLSVSPKSVTVGEDGKLNAEVTLAFESDKDVAEAAAELGLTIGELTKKVAITYSAAVTVQKVYAQSIDIEKIVMDNGKGFDIRAELTKLGYDYADLDQLDSLDDSKDANNEPYLGLKIKKADGFIGCWIRPEAKITVKFGKVSDNVKFIANGADMTKTPTDLAEPFTFTAGNADTYVEFHTTTAATVVVKAITIEGGVPLSTDVALNWLKIDGQEVTAKDNSYAYEVPAESEATEVTVTFELHDAKAKADKENSFTVAIPASSEAAASEADINVTAEDGKTKATYKVVITRAKEQQGIEAISDERATIKTIENGQLVIIRGGKKYTATGAEIR